MVTVPKTEKLLLTWVVSLTHEGKYSKWGEKK